MLRGMSTVMLKTTRAALAVIALSLSLPACAKPAPEAAKDADPALWVVKDADTTIYLFGTIHVLKPGLTWFDEAVKAAFDKSDTLVMEMVQPDPATMQQLVIATGLTTSGPALSEQVPADKRAAYDKALAGQGVPETTFDHMKPWLAAVTLSLTPLEALGYDAVNAPETVLTKAATGEGKTIAGLETAAQQFGYFNSLSKDAQMTFLTSTIDELPTTGATMAQMVTNWSNGDPDALAREMNDDLKESPEVAKTILYDRNARWAGWIAARMKTPGTVFVAVGAGHLAGPDSVIAKLGGYRLKAVRVKY